MMKPALVLLFLLGGAASAWGQSAADLRAKYREFAAFEVRENVMMIPRYTADGQVCEMFVERRHGTESVIDLESFFEDEEVKTLVDELVPEAERGENLTELAAKHPKSLEDLLPITIAGWSSTTHYRYENVLIRVYGMIDVDDFARQAKGEKIPPGCPERNVQCFGNMVITITWRNRQCADANK